MHVTDGPHANLTVLLEQSLSAPNPAVYRLGVHLVLLTELGGKITFLRCYENVMAGSNRRYEKEQNPRKIEYHRNPQQNENAAKVKGIS